MHSERDPEVLGPSVERATTAAAQTPTNWTARVALVLAGTSLLIAGAVAVRTSDQNEKVQADPGMSSGVPRSEYNDLRARVAELEVRTVRVPNVIGLTLEKAQDLLGAAGFRATAEPPYDFRVPKDCVIARQHPGGGGFFEPDTPIVLRLGPPPNDPQLECSHEAER